jgi:4a-hydroxytetrahydrobiopterin dehydratase
MTELEHKRCLACEAGVPPLTPEKIQGFLKEVPGWTLSPDGLSIEQSYSFKNFYKTMAFVNAIAWIANQENHHPDLSLGYNYCHVKFTTHALGGLSENDFICAAKLNALQAS